MHDEHQTSSPEEIATTKTSTTPSNTQITEKGIYQRTIIRSINVSRLSNIFSQLIQLRLLFNRQTPQESEISMQPPHQPYPVAPPSFPVKLSLR